MIKKLKYPKVVGAVIFSWALIALVYNLTFSKTVELISEINLLKTEISDFENSKASIDTTSFGFGKNDISDFGSKNLQEEIVQIINSKDRGKSRLNRMYELEEIGGDGIKVQIQPVLLEGDYFDMLSTLHYIENEIVQLHVPSVELFKERNRKTKRDELYMKIYVQKII